MKHPSHDRLWVYIDGRAGEGESSQIAAHLQVCSTCAQEAASGKTLLRMLRTVPDEAAPPGFRLRVMQRVRASEASAPKIGRSAGLRWVAALGATAVAATIGWSIWSGPTPSGTTPERVEFYVQEHLRYETVRQLSSDVFQPASWNGR